MCCVVRSWFAMGALGDLFSFLLWLLFAFFFSFFFCLLGVCAVRGVVFFRSVFFFVGLVRVFLVLCRFFCSFLFRVFFFLGGGCLSLDYSLIYK